MANDTEDNAGIMFIGGILAIVILGGVVLKALGELFNQLAVTLNSFAHMVVSFSVLVLAVLRVAGVVAIIGGVIVMSIYFTYKYVMMVKRGSELKKYVNERLDTDLGAFRIELTDSFFKKVDGLSHRVGCLDNDVAKLKAPPAPIAPLPAEPTGVPEGGTVPTNGNGASVPQDPAKQGQIEAVPAPLDVTNPY